MEIQGDYLLKFIFLYCIRLCKMIKYYHIL